MPLTHNTKITSINQQQLLSSVENNLKKKLFTTISIHETDKKNVQYEILLNQIKVLDCDQWPADLPVGYGEEEIQNICTGFQLNAAKIKKNAYWEYLDNSHCNHKELNELMRCTKLIACSSAECERGVKSQCSADDTRTRIAKGRHQGAEKNVHGSLCKIAPNADVLCNLM
ncbi:hypothetical protein PR048_028295 [Dryococelus australis]|uniref:Uncharacterized protein n=1 Tax=Dryococelus australis TaxID=614101 RepID=A0ABQ9GIW4_9NEOP|nr:hypothetical protein PR048_028295 [Dryococelus australis]